MLKPDETALIFGGYGLVGLQIARLVARHHKPKKMVLASLFAHESEAAVKLMSAEFPAIEFVPEQGNIFVRSSLAGLSRDELLSQGEVLRQLYIDTFHPLDASDKNNILEQSLLCQIVRRHKPALIVDAVNTATGISYQNVATASDCVFRFHSAALDAIEPLNDDLLKRAESGDAEAVKALASGLRELRSLYKNRLADDISNRPLKNDNAVYAQLISQIVPQLVRHVLLVYKVCREVGTRMYLKIGTSGTGGMGLNIPYTHGEDRPSFPLLAKSSVGFAHSGLLFLLARTPGPTIFKEVKPAALIGYRKVETRPITKLGRKVELHEPRKDRVAPGETLSIHEPENFRSQDILTIPGVDTGENGFFARGEFETITYLGQMEFITPQEIAEIAFHEISGRNTGKDVVQGLAGTVLDPSYRGGFLRPLALNELDVLQRESGSPSVAIGQLGPPQLSKLLFESFLLARIHPTIKAWQHETRSDAELSEQLCKELEASAMDRTITALGIPIRMPDGESILRGGTLAIPELLAAKIKIDSNSELESWTQKGWVDLRAENIGRWRQRFKEAAEAQARQMNEGSARFDRETYPYEDLRPGELVGWIFNHEPLLGEEAMGGRLW
jgi:hypothetical protein